jgi:hypothetical protein
MPLSFENVTTIPIISGSAVLQEVSSPNSNFPQLITVGPVAVQTEQLSQVVFTWNQSGPMALFLYGEWRFDVFFEQMGHLEMLGPVPKQTVTYNPIAGTGFTATVTMLPGTIPVGLYRVTARMMLLPITSGSAFSDTAISPIVAFEDLGFVQYHNA